MPKYVAIYTVEYALLIDAPSPEAARRIARKDDTSQPEVLFAESTFPREMQIRPWPLQAPSP